MGELEPPTSALSDGQFQYPFVDIFTRIEWIGFFDDW
jgi:hypothetical protein